MIRRIAAALLGAVLVAPLLGVAHGQSAGLQRRLAEAERLDCTFSTLVTGTWEDGAAQASVAPSQLDIAFFDINVDEGSAEAEGAFGASFISARFSQGYLHLMQVSDTGPLYVTTVLAQELADDRLMAVHVRLEYAATVLPGFTSRPEMYVGSCAVAA